MSRRRNAIYPHPQSPSVMLTDDPEFDVRFYNKMWRIWSDGGRSNWVQLSNVVRMVQDSMGYDARHSYNGSLLVQGLGFAGAGRLSMEEENILRHAKGAEMKRLVTRALHLLNATDYMTVGNAKDAWRHALREKLLGRKVPSHRTLDEPWWREQMHQLYLASKATKTQNPRRRNPATGYRNLRLTWSDGTQTVGTTRKTLAEEKRAKLGGTAVLVSATGQRRTVRVVKVEVLSGRIRFSRRRRKSNRRH